ncbi:dihydrofolate reductase [Candidatus Roizmanbacteria bacterium]|nr:dihydrofolate reductase [Candidatus Roizmanbacteria bacterium]
MSENRVIGRNNKILWHIKGDLQRLKEKTKGHVVVLGRKTFESMVWYYNRSGNLLPGKLYIVVTHDKEYKPARENAVASHSINEAIKVAKEKEKNEVFIIGGQRIFEQTIDMADKLYLTVVEGDFEGDAFFPDYSEFIKKVFEKKGEEGKYKYTFIDLERKPV